MQYRMTVAAVVCPLILAACSKPADAPPAGTAPAAAAPMTTDAAATTMDATAMKDTIAALERAWSAAFRAGDAAALARLYTEDGASLGATGEWLKGRDAIAANIKSQVDTLTVLTRTDAPDEVIAAGDQIVEFGRYAMSATVKKSGKPVVSEGRYVVLWRKDTDGAWRLHRDLSTETKKP